MLYFIGNADDANATKKHLPENIFIEALNIAKILDAEYGSKRNILTDDGGYILIAETVTDLDYICMNYVDIRSKQPEQVNILVVAPDYCNALYLLNNEFGVNVIMPMCIALSLILEGMV